MRTTAMPVHTKSYALQLRVQRLDLMRLDLMTHAMKNAHARDREEPAEDDGGDENEDDGGSAAVDDNERRAQLRAERRKRMEERSQP
jgi:hypothetical protein